jgi:hypothetical protein
LFFPPTTHVPTSCTHAPTGPTQVFSVCHSYHATCLPTSCPAAIPDTTPSWWTRPTTACCSHRQLAEPPPPLGSPARDVDALPVFPSFHPLISVSLFSTPQHHQEATPSLITIVLQRHQATDGAQAPLIISSVPCPKCDATALNDALDEIPISLAFRFATSR